MQCQGVKFVTLLREGVDKTVPTIVTVQVTRSELRSQQQEGFSNPFWILAGILFKVLLAVFNSLNILLLLNKLQVNLISEFKLKL